MNARDARQRLQKADAEVIINALKDLGLTVRQKENYIWASTPGGRHVCGFYWNTARKSKAEGEPDIPGSWQLLLGLSFVFSLADLRTVLREVRRVQPIVSDTVNAWKAFLVSKSDRRWREYRSHVAALFLRQDPEPEENT